MKKQQQVCSHTEPNRPACFHCRPFRVPVKITRAQLAVKGGAISPARFESFMSSVSKIVVRSPSGVDVVTRMFAGGTAR